MILIILAVALAVGQRVDAPRTLVAGGSIHESLAGGERALFAIDVPAETAARVVVQQEGVDVAVTLYRQGGPPPARALDLVSGPIGDELVLPPVLDSRAVWEIVVSASLPQAARGDYTIVFELGPADREARAKAAARAQHLDAWETARATDGPSLQRAEAGFAAAAAAAAAAGDAAQAAESTFQRGLTRELLGDLSGSVELHRQSLAAFRQLGRRDRQARVLNRLGDQLRKMSEHAEAQQSFDEALAIARDVRDPVVEVEILNNSALQRADLGYFEEAIERYRAALPTARRLEMNVTELSLLCNIAESHTYLGAFDTAIALYQDALAVADRVNIPRRTGRTLYMLAEAHIENGDRVKAERALRAALPLYDQSGDRLGYAVTETLLARVLYANGDLDATVEKLSRALPALEAGRARGAAANALRTLAEVDLDRGAFDASLARLDKALALDRLGASRETEALTLYLQARALRAKGRTDDALASIAGSVALVEGLRGAVQRSDLRTSYLAMVRRYFDLYVDLLQLRGDAAAAFEISERARARTLLEGLAEAAARIDKGVDPKLLARERDVQAALNAKEAVRAQATAAAGAQSAAAVAAGRELDRLVEDLRRIQTTIRASSPAYWSLKRPEPISAARVQTALLDADSVLVEYHVGEARSFVWVIDPAAITVHELPPAATIDAAARRYHELLSRETNELALAARERLNRDAAAAGRRLAALVWAPIEPRVRARRVVIVADGALQYVPFAALPAGSTSGEPLLAQHEIVYLPSASVLDTLRRDRRPAPALATAAVFADPVFSKNDPRFAGARDASAPSATRAADGLSYGRLRFSRREAEAISAVSPGAFEALDFAAAKNTVMARDLSRYRILHFATHGTLNTAHPELSGLVFSLVNQSGQPIDGFLRLHEIYNLNLNAELVVLSACRTALGKEIHGEGLIGLTRGFMFAGSARVVSSVWNVDDRASSVLMSRFYTEMLTKHLSPAAALRAAQLSMLREVRWSNPHDWAAFSLHGEWK